MWNRFIPALILALPMLHAQVESWDLPPVKYSDTPARDRVAKLVEKWAKDPASLKGATPLERVRAVLAELHVPEASQVLVFSKTSKQNGLIRPDNPRALYFSPDCYCGYVPGGVMEVAVQDPALGPVFYLIDLGNPTKPPRVERDTSDCLSCHATGRTEHVPGLLVRSVYPDGDGHPLLHLGTGLVDHQTPIAERWGGYYVTGSIALPHLGNRTYAGDEKPNPAVFAWENLEETFDTRKYARATSDIVALMVLEHQCHAHNLLTAAAMDYKRAYYLGKAMNPDSNPDAGSAGKVADSAAEKIVEWFLFSGEAGQGEDGVEGNEEFQEQFQAAIPKSKGGDSLADFQLNGRLFKNRCSYMIYSEAFRELPVRVKSEVIKRLQHIFESPAANDSHPEIKTPERHKIAAILRETHVFP